jgi:hypothetical protein
LEKSTKEKLIERNKISEERQDEGKKREVPIE